MASTSASSWSDVTTTRRCHVTMNVFAAIASCACSFVSTRLTLVWTVRGCVLQLRLTVKALHIATFCFGHPSQASGMAWLSLLQKHNVSSELVYLEWNPYVDASQYQASLTNGGKCHNLHIQTLTIHPSPLAIALHCNYQKPANNLKQFLTFQF